MKEKKDSFYIPSPKVFEQMMLRFPHSRPLYWGDYCSRSLGAYMGLILFFSGHKSVKHTVSWTCGEKEPQNIQVHPFSVIVEPYIESPEKDIPLLWFLLRKAEIRYSGGAGQENKSYVQACPSDRNHEQTIQEMVRTFNALKDEFPI